MSYTVAAIYLAFQVLYLVVASSQIVLVASKFYKHLIGKSETTRTRSNSFGLKTIANAMETIQDKFVAFSSFALLSCCILAAMRSLVFILGYTRVISCALMAHFGASMFQVFKTLMYLVFIFRAEAIYRDTVYAYNTQRMKGAAAIIVLLNAGIFVLYNVFVTGYEKEDAGALCVCGAKAKAWMFVVAPSVLQDIFVNLWLLHLFTRPLQLLRERVMKTVSPTAAPLPLECKPSNETCSSGLSSEQASDICTGAVVRESTASRSVELGTRGDDFSDLRRVAVKCAVVTWVAVVSTLINLILVGSLGFMEFIVLDWLINNTCMILMTNWCDRYFPKLCCVPLTVARILPSCLCGDVPEF